MAASLVSTADPLIFWWSIIIWSIEKSERNRHKLLDEEQHWRQGSGMIGREGSSTLKQRSRSLVDMGGEAAI